MTLSSPCRTVRFNVVLLICLTVFRRQVWCRAWACLHLCHTSQSRRQRPKKSTRYALNRLGLAVNLLSVFQSDQADTYQKISDQIQVFKKIQALPCLALPGLTSVGAHRPRIRTSPGVRSRPTYFSLFDLDRNCVLSNRTSPWRRSRALLTHTGARWCDSCTHDRQSLVLMLCVIRVFQASRAQFLHIAYVCVCVKHRAERSGQGTLRAAGEG